MAPAEDHRVLQVGDLQGLISSMVNFFESADALIKRHGGEGSYLGTQAWEQRITLNCWFQISCTSTGSICDDE